MNWYEKIIQWFARIRGDQNEFEQRRHGWALLVALCLAVLLWFMINMRGRHTDWIDIETDVMNMPEGQALEEGPPPTVRVQVEGEGWELLTLYTDPKKILLDATVGTVNLVEAATESLPRELNIQNVDPAVVEIKMDQKIRRRVPIYLDAIIKPDSPYDFTDSLRIEPDSVYIEGAEILVNGIESWPTSRYEQTGVRASFTAQIPLRQAPGGLVQVFPPQTELFVNLEEFTEIERELIVQVTDRPAGEAQVTVIPDRVLVRYRIRLDQVAEAEKSSSFFARVPYQTVLADTTGYVTPVIHIPPDLVIKDIRTIQGRLRYYMVLE